MGTKRVAFTLALSGVVFLGCQGRPNETKGTPTSKSVREGAAPATSDAPKSPEVFGEKPTLEKKTTLSNVLEKPESFKEGAVLVEGEVRRACSKKGCWMELATAADESAPGCRVTFKDYGFFVPTNSAGSRALVEGKVEVTIVPKARVDHLEAEGARFSSKNPDGTANEVRIVATGVELSRRS